MSHSGAVRHLAAVFTVVGVSILLVGCGLARAQSVERTNVHILVTDAETGQPINQARLTLQFAEPGGPSRFNRPKKLAYSAKTNSQGKYKFMNIPKGTLKLFVTAEKHQSYGKEIELEKDEQVIEIKLKKPQPLQ